MAKKKFEEVLTNLPNDMLAVILGKVGEKSHTDLNACIVACKTFQSISKYLDVVMKLNLKESFPPPWTRIPENSELLYECAGYGNIHAIFLCGLIDFYYKKFTVAGAKQLMVAAEASHPEAMYLCGMILINQGRYSEGSNYLKQLWKKKGFEAVRRCIVNCKPVLLELNVRDYIAYVLLLTDLEVGDDCVVREYDDVCEHCFVYKEIFRFIDYMHYV